MSPAACFAALYYVFNQSLKLTLPDMKVTELGLVYVEEKVTYTFQQILASSAVTLHTKTTLGRCFSLQLYLFFGGDGGRVK